jgi:hypothetical protein
LTGAAALARPLFEPPIPGALGPSTDVAFSGVCLRRAIVARQQGQDHILLHPRLRANGYPVDNR